jgi:hypothetical protein
MARAVSSARGGVATFDRGARRSRGLFGIAVRVREVERFPGRAVGPFGDRLGNLRVGSKHAARTEESE